MPKICKFLLVNYCFRETAFISLRTNWLVLANHDNLKVPSPYSLLKAIYLPEPATGEGGAKDETNVVPLQCKLCPLHICIMVLQPCTIAVRLLSQQCITCIIILTKIIRSCRHLCYRLSQFLTCTDNILPLVKPLVSVFWSLLEISLSLPEFGRLIYFSFLKYSACHVLFLRSKEEREYLPYFLLYQVRIH